MSETGPAAFKRKARELATEHGDFLARLTTLTTDGRKLERGREKLSLDAHPIFQDEVMNAGEVGAVTALWLTTKDGNHDARALASVFDDKAKTVVEARRIMRRVAQSGFAQKYERPLNDADSYRQQRAEDIRSGRRRVR
jgi:hypothetical protein